MALDLTARFSLLDQMSNQIDSIALAGLSMVEQFEQAGDVASSALDSISGGASGAVSSVNGVASSIAEVSTQIDHWTEAAENYDKSAMEAIYTTEDLVDMGMKSAEALQEQEDMMALCEQSATSLSKSMEAATEVQSELGAAMDEAAELTAELSKNEDVSAETKAALAKAATDAAEAMNELSAAQQEAESAMAAYDEVMASGTTDLETLEAAAERAGHAADALAEANGKASDATDELSKATEKASEEAEDGGEKGVNAIESIAGALASAGIVAKMEEIAESVYALVDAFSEAESTVVKATGASGAALDGLTQSMMNAYAASKSGSLDDTAGAIGEINTRMGLTGEELTAVTGQFLDFANITGTNVVGSVQNVTKIMNKWGVEGSNVESVLDKLAYAGQISGVSVDTLSSTLITGAASFQEMGLSLDNAISMLAQFELYGMSGTTAITAMRTAVKNFSDDGLDASTALQDVINEIANMESAADATALAVETFGSRAGVDMVNAIRSGALTVDTLTGSLEAADGTLEKTAATAQTLSQKWTQAGNNINSAFTSAIEPAVSGISSGLADIANGIGTFLNEHPAVTKGLTATGVGIGVVVAGFALYTAGTSIATAATALFGTTLSAALLPITAIAAAISAVTAAVLFFGDSYTEAYDETMSMTAVTAQQTEELEALESQYESACAQYGATSEEASRLKYQIDDLSASLEANGQSVEEFCAATDDLISKHNELMQSFDDTSQSVSDEEIKNMALIQKLADLASATDQTAASQATMESIITELNSNLDGLNLSYEDLISNQDGAIASLRAYAQAQAEQQHQQALVEEYIALTEQQATEQAKLSSVNDEVAAATERATKKQQAYLEACQQLNEIDPTGMAAMGAAASEEAAAANAAADALAQVTEKQAELQDAYDETTSRMQEIEDEWNGIAEASEEAAKNPSSYEEAVQIAYNGVKTELEELCTAYDEAYQSALASFQGQFGLFDEAQADMDATVSNAQAALDSQLAYWDNYLANVEVLKNTSAEDLGITQENYEALMAYAQDGSEQAAGLAASMAEAINSGNSEAVTQLANTVGEVSAKQQEIASMTADWKANLSAELAGIGEEMSAAVESMDLSAEAQAAAQSTIGAYIQQLQTGSGTAVAQAQSISKQIEAALQGAEGGAYKADVQFDVDSTEVDNYTPEDKEATAAYYLDSSRVDNWDPPDKTATVTYNVVTRGSAPGHAHGTTNAESIFIAGENGPELVARPTAAYATGTTNSTDFFIAGENGPELIVGEQGSTVFPTSETDRLIDALNARRQPLQVFAGDGGESGSAGGRAAEQVKRILLEIAGSGAIEVNGSGGVDRTTVLEILTDHLKPVLMQIIQSEIYEEGELAYEY